MIFCDTSAIFALADPNDRDHEEAERLWSRARDAGRPFITHNYVIVESLALVQRRLGSAAAGLVARSASAFDIVWVEPDLHEEAVRRFLERSRRHVSLVDEVSFLVMRSRGIETVFGFDPDFEREGFRRLSV